MEAHRANSSVPVFIVKTSYVDCGNGRKERRNVRRTRSKVVGKAEERRPLNDPSSKGTSDGRERGFSS